MTKLVKECLPMNMSYLPDDIMLNCLGRVSRLYYPILSLVSKRFRSLIASLDLYKTRTLLGRTETCLYVCLSFGSESIPRWFTLCRRPTRNPKPNVITRWFTPCFKPYRIQKSSNNLLVSVTSCNLSLPLGFTPIAVGCNIYIIGAYINGACTSRVFFMDCRSYTWHEAPSMQMVRMWPFVSVIDEKIYVVESHLFDDYSNLIEVFDTKTKRWEHVTSPNVEILEYGFISKSLAIEGKLYLFGSNQLMVYEPKENKWQVTELDDTYLEMALSIPYCVINNIIYCCSSSMLFWYSSQVRSLIPLEGLKEFHKLPICSTSVRLVDYGGKIAVLWENIVGSDDKKKIWCAVISPEMRDDGEEIYGEIEWCGVVLTVPKSSSLMQSLAVNV